MRQDAQVIRLGSRERKVAVARRYQVGEWQLPQTTRRQKSFRLSSAVPRKTSHVANAERNRKQKEKLVR